MRKALAFLLGIFICFILIFCTSNDNSPTTQKPDEEFYSKLGWLEKDLEANRAVFKAQLKEVREKYPLIAFGWDVQEALLVHERAGLPRTDSLRTILEWLTGRNFREPPVRDRSRAIKYLDCLMEANSQDYVDACGNRYGGPED